MGYDTNKWRVRNDIFNEDGGNWYVAFGRELTETDALAGVVAAGISIYAGNPGPFLKWFEDLIRESIWKMKESLQDLGEEVGEDMIEEAVQIASQKIRDLLGGNPQGGCVKKSFSTLDFKAGVATYSGRNWIKLCNFVRCWKETVSSTWSAQPYVAVRLKQGTAVEIENQRQPKRAVEEQDWLTPTLYVLEN